MSNKLGEQIVQRFAGLQTDRSLRWDGKVQETFDFVKPYDNQVISQFDNDPDRYNHIYDTTALDAHDIFVAGMYANITPPDDNWAIVTSSDKKLKENRIVQRYFSSLTEATAEQMANSNFSLEIQSLWSQIAAAGTGTLFTFENSDFSKTLRYRTTHFAESYIDEAPDRLIDTVFILQRLSTRQAVLRWGIKNLSLDLQGEANDIKKQSNKHFFISAVFPRAERNITRLDKLNMPWATVHVEHETKHLISQSGFPEKPFATMRFWLDAKDIYGVGPGLRSLANTKTLNAMKLTVLKRANMEGDPQRIAPNDESTQRMETTPGSTIYYDINEAGSKPEYMELTGSFSVGEFAINEEKEAIRKAFLVDFFALLQNLGPDKQRTAFEIGERIREKIDLISFIRGRSDVELLTPTMNRTTNILDRRGVFPEKPEEVIKNPAFEIEYRGRLAILARSLRLKAVREFTDFTLGYMEVNPEIADNIDFDAISNIAKETLNTPNEVVFTEQQRDQIRKIRAEQEQIKNAETLSKSVKNLQSNTEENSPLNQLQLTA